MEKPDLNFFQYFKELSPESVHGMVIQRRHSLEMNEKLLEIERDLDILEFQYSSELCCTRTDGKFDENDNGVDKADVDERWSCADLLDAVEISQLVHVNI